MDNIEIQILDSDNSILGTLVVADSDKFPLSLTKSLANLKNINEKSGSYSTSFKIASTKDNDILLEHLYYASEKNYKDWDADKRARIIVNGIDIDTGRLRVDRVSAKGDARDYNFTFFGDNMDWVLLMQDKYFNDLPYLDQDIDWLSAPIEASWTNTAGNYTPVFSLLNRGQRLTPDMTLIPDFYPDYFVYDVIKDAFKLIGYNLNSSFIEQDKFKKLITPFFSENFRIAEEDLESQSAFVKLDNSITNYNLSITPVNNWQDFTFYLDNTYSSTQPVNYYNYPFEGGTNNVGYIETTPYYDNAGNWDTHFGSNSNTSHVYTVAINGYYKVTLDTSSTQSSDDGWISNYLDYRVFKRVGAAYPIHIGGNMDVISEDITTNVVGSTTYTNTHGVYESASHYFNAGERIYIGGKYSVRETYSTTGAINIALTHYDNTTVKVEQQSTLVAGNTFNWKEVSDNKYSLLKYITDIGKLFNWYFRTDTATRTVYIESRDDFYKALSTATNWTDKIDDNKQHELYYNSKYYTQLQRFSYSEDSDDKFIEWWNKKVGGDFQNLLHEYPEKFKTGTTTLQLDVIAPTINAVDNFTGGETPITSFLWDNDPTENIPAIKLNYKPRLLYYNYSTQQNVDGTSKSFLWNSESTPRTTIPYAIAFPRVVNDVVLADVEDSLDFKDSTSFYSTGSVLDTSITNLGLYTQYYQKTAREILEGKRLNINLFLDLVDYKNLDLRKPIYFDNRYADIEGYWRIEKISNFKPLGNQSTLVELIQAKNFVKLPYNPIGGDTVPDYSEGQEYMRVANQTNGSRVSQDSPTNVLGFNNIVEPKSTVVGDFLESSTPNTTRMGVYNLDVSSDTFQLGVGTKEESYSLIRADRDGNILFNGELIRGGLYDSTKIVTKTANFTASVLTETYLCDTSSNDIDVTFPATIKIGKVWNFKKMSGNNILELRADFDNTTNLTITSQYDNAAVQWTGTNFVIL